MRVVDGFAGRRGRVVVDVEDVNGLAVNQLQAVEVGAALVDVVDIRQQTGLRAPAFDGHVHGFAQTAEGRGEAPHFHLRRDANLLTEVQQLAVAQSGLAQSDRGLSGPGRRRRDARSADRPHQVHVAASFFQARGSLGVVVVDPVGETNGALDR